MAPVTKLDHSALRTNQAVIIFLSLLAFILNLPLLAGGVGLVMAAGTLFRRPGFGFVYRFLLRPLGLLRPEVLEDNSEPHRFAQGFGAAVIFGSLLALSFGMERFGWGLVWLVIGLAALNLFGGFCVGCALYYWFNRIQVPGFTKSAPPGTRPGMRPKLEGK